MLSIITYYMYITYYTELAVPLHQMCFVLTYYVGMLPAHYTI